MKLSHWISRRVAAHPDAETALIEIRHLAAAVTGLSLTQQRIHDPDLDVDTEAALDALAARLCAGEPLAYLLGNQSFYGLDLAVTHATLIPRSDSEAVVERALHHLRGIPRPTVLDLGTGSGALALAIAAGRPDADVTGSDQSTAALAVATENARRLHMANVRFQHGDWLAPFADASADLIISNPPYIAPDDPHLAALRHEPLSALVAADDGYHDLHTIMDSAPRVLKMGGWLIMEHGWQQGEALRVRAARDSVWQHIATGQDYAHRDRYTEMQKARG